MLNGSIIQIVCHITRVPPIRSLILFYRLKADLQAKINWTHWYSVTRLQFLKNHPAFFKGLLFLCLNS